jgi:hypothetical protein
LRNAQKPHPARAAFAQALYYSENRDRVHNTFASTIGAKRALFGATRWRICHTVEATSAYYRRQIMSEMFHCIAYESDKKEHLTFEAAEINLSSNQRAKRPVFLVSPAMGSQVDGP